MREVQRVIKRDYDLMIIMVIKFEDDDFTNFNIY